MQVGVHLLLFVVQILFASLAITGKIVLRDFPAGSIVLFRVVGAAIVLLLVNLIWTRRWVHDRRDLVRLGVLGLLGVVLNQSLFLIGLSHTTAINATILVTTIPIFTVLYSVLTRREPPSALKFAGIGVAACGALYLIGPDRWSQAPELALGNLLIVVAMFFYALYLVHSKAMVMRYGPVTVSAYVMLFSAVGHAAARPLGAGLGGPARGARRDVGLGGVHRRLPDDHRLLPQYLGAPPSLSRTWWRRTSTCSRSSRRSSPRRSLRANGSPPARRSRG